MRLLLSIFIAIGFTLVVALGIRSVLADLLALTRHRPPSIFDEFPEDDPQSGGPESGGPIRPGASTYALHARASLAASSSVERRNPTS
jgi:hypothetical protein